LIELEMVVAKCARDWGATGKILVYKGTNDLLFESFLSIDKVVGNAKLLGHVSRVVHVVD